MGRMRMTRIRILWEGWGGCGLFEAFFSSSSQAVWGRSETKGKGGVRYCRHKEGLASLKKSIQLTTEKCKFSCIHQNHQQINFKFPSSPLLFWGFRGPLYRKANIWTHFRQIWTNNKTTQNFFNMFLLQTVTVISNGRIEQITRYNCVFTHILIIVFCAFSPGKKVHLCFFSTMYNFQKFLLLISM